MRNSTLIAAALATFVASTAFAESDLFRPQYGQAARLADQTNVRNGVTDKNGQPYRLTGERRELTRRVVYRDVPAGRGQTQSLPFVVTVEE